MMLSQLLVIEHRYYFNDISLNTFQYNRHLFFLMLISFIKKVKYEFSDRGSNLFNWTKLDEFNDSLSIFVLAESWDQIFYESVDLSYNLVLIFENFCVRLQKVKKVVWIEELATSFKFLDSIGIPPFGVSDVHLLVHIFNTPDSIDVTLGNLDFSQKYPVIHSDHGEFIIFTVIPALKGNTKCASLLVLINNLFCRRHNTVETLDSFIWPRWSEKATFCLLLSRWVLALIPWLIHHWAEISWKNIIISSITFLAVALPLSIPLKLKVNFQPFQTLYW